MDQLSIQYDARIKALEFIVASLLGTRANLEDNPVQWLEKQRVMLRDICSTHAVGGFDPATSDSFVGELQDAIDEILERATERVRPPDNN